jgi:hypothetical protein
VPHEPLRVCYACLGRRAHKSASQAGTSRRSGGGGRYATLSGRTRLPCGTHHPAHRRGRRHLPHGGHSNTNYAVIWVHSYVPEDKSKTYCVYDALSPDAIRRNYRSVDTIIHVQVTVKLLVATKTATVLR